MSAAGCGVRGVRSAGCGVRSADCGVRAACARHEIVLPPRPS
jgi:hypothetical protein